MATIDDKIEKIGKILIQAERASTEEEADHFFKMAQKLSSTYSVELEKARQSILNKEQRENPINKRITIGEAGKPLNATMCSLFMEIGEAQDLKFNIAHNSTYVIAFGFPSDIAITEAMYAHVVHQMVEEANAFIKKGDWRGDKTWDDRTYTYKPVHARVARRCFYEAFTSRIGSRLREAKREAEKELQQVDTEAHVEESTSTALVLKNKRAELGEFYQRTSNARGSWKGSRNTYTSSTGRTAGSEAGSRARLGGQQAISGGRTAIN